MLQRQVALNAMPRAAKTAQNEVRVDVIEGKLCAMCNETILRKIDCRLFRLRMFEKVCLNSFFHGSGVMAKAKGY
jgi:hypothetical protein